MVRDYKIHSKLQKSFFISEKQIYDWVRVFNEKKKRKYKQYVGKVTALHKENYDQFFCEKSCVYKANNCKQ